MANISPKKASIIRQRVLKCQINGLTVKETAYYLETMLGISVSTRTVKRYREEIYRRIEETGLINKDPLSVNLSELIELVG